VDSAVADEERVRRDEWRMTMTAFVKFAGIAAGLAMVAGHAVAADIPQTAPPPAPAPVYAPPAFTWTGFYGGFNVGYAWRRDTMNILVPGQNIGANAAALAGAVGNNSFNTNSFTAGLTAGMNSQWNNLVVGVEGDINWMGGRGRGASPIATLGGESAVAFDRARSNWLATLRGRFGFAFDRTMIYATGGLAFSDLKRSRNLDWTFADGCPPTGVGAFQRCHSGSVSTSVGGAVGGGVEHAFTDNWTMKAEYLYVRFPDKTFTTFNAGPGFAGAPQPLVHTAKNRNHIFRVGVNYLFR